MKAIKVSVIGASGYGGAETVRLLATHPQVQLMHVTAETKKGAAMSSLYPNLRGFVDQTMIEVDLERIGSDSDVTIVSLPSGMAMRLVPELLKQGSKVIDVAADFRLKRPELYPQWYNVTHTAPEYLSEAVYGLSELHRDAIARARLVADPGCYPAAAILALMPLLRAGSVRTQGIVIDAKSGVSGAGRGGGGGFGFSEANENVKAYSVVGHNHTAEIEQELSGIAGTTVQVVFTPHLIPMTRGILVTAYAPLVNDLSEPDALALYQQTYAREPFVRVLDSVLPETKATLGSNLCDVAVRVNQRAGVAIAIAAIDNLGKGAAGQAVQNLNLMCGLPEETGLKFPGVYP
ncbi:MAG TPA: N-acetyl-gamma-glutamyl-phosphate reductase [Candidatus Tectomicrobia bacterium]|nr:N-acetyl-gamma-glutamyl-phosphate reductase [Candidatus Tectomicrobia bacterium]